MKGAIAAVAFLSSLLASASPVPSPGVWCVLQSSETPTGSHFLGQHPVLPLDPSTRLASNATSLDLVSLYAVQAQCSQLSAVTSEARVLGEVKHAEGSELLLLAQQWLDLSVPTFEAAVKGETEIPRTPAAWRKQIGAIGGLGLDLSDNEHALLRRGQLVLSTGAVISEVVKGDIDLVGVSTTHALALAQVPSARLAQGLESLVPSNTRLLRLPALSRTSPVHALENGKPNPSYARPKFNPLVDDLLQSSLISTDRIRRDVRILTGEDQSTLPKGAKGWHTRHSASWGAKRAAKWIRDRLDDSLASLPHTECHFDEYDVLYSPLIVCTIPETKELRAKDEGDDEDNKEEGIVVISAHYDSRGTFGETTAPGADDDGSGTALLLGLARVLGRSGVRFGREVRIVAFSGEEQGLLGSQYYAKKLKDEGVKIRMALQIDMIAFRKENEPLQVAFPSHLATASLTSHIQRIAQVYVPELVVGFTEVCCSDHQSFWEVGYPATWTFERTGPIADPKYHNSGDLSTRPGYDFKQLQATTKVVIATLFNVAGFWI